MVRRHNRLLVAFHVGTDAVMAMMAFLLAYVLRFESGLFEITRGQPPIEQYFSVLPFVALVVPLGFHFQGLYRLRRGRSRIDDFFNVLVGSIFAVVLGILAGWFRGWVDEVVQYLYTTLTSVPNVLLIAACVLMVQVALDKHPDWFETGAERSDIKVFLLCFILGVTGWSTLCRLVRAETLKLRELEFVQAATAFGVAPLRIMARHILPNVMHLVLITTVLSFSDLILYEAVLTYVGVGVDPSTSSFGGMINLARSEMSRDPVVWWSFASAFGFMVTLVLAANLFADGVRDAFDPRSRAQRPRLSRRVAA